MTYNPNIPSDVDFMDISQSELQTNFQQLNTVFSVDHVAFDAISNRGKHNKVTLLSRGTDVSIDSPETSSAEYALYSLTDGSNVDVYMRGQSNQTPTRMTKNNEMFLRVYPVFAVNLTFQVAAPGYVVNSSFNLASTVLGADRITFNYTNPVLDPVGNPQNNYMYYATSMALSSYGQTVVARARSPSQNLAMRSNLIIIEIVNRNESVVSFSDLLNLIVVCWRVQ